MAVNPIKVNVRASNGIDIEVLIDPSESTQYLKDLVEVYTGFANQYVELVFGGQLIGDGFLRDYQIVDGSEIFLRPSVPEDPTRRNTTLVNVITLDGKNFPILVNLSDTIDHLKKLIRIYTKQAYARIPTEDQELFFNGAELKVGNLKDAGVVNGSGILLRQRFVATQNPIRLNITKPDGNRLPILIRPSETVEFLQKQIELYTGIFDIDQELFFNGVRLNSGSLTAIGVLDQSEIVLQQCNPPSFEISVKTGSGEGFTLRVKENFTVEDLKSLIHQKEGTVPTKQQLVASGKKLENGHTLADYGI